MFNLHMHTWRCHHAKGDDEEFVLKAIENGYKTIGFSDHAPYVFPKEHISSFRMECELAEDYASSVKYLREKYKDKIDIKLGFEVEWYPLFIKKELEFLKSFGYDYLILGQHYTDSEVEPYAKYAGAKTDDVKTLDKYINQVIDGAKSGEILYIAHPDLINFTGSKAVYRERMRYFTSEIKKLDIPLEFNFLGFSETRNYPNDDFWKIVKETGNRVVIGLDAHSPDVYSNKNGLEKMKAKIASFGLTPIENVEELLNK